MMFEDEDLGKKYKKIDIKRRVFFILFPTHNLFYQLSYRTLKKCDDDF